jgi:hypothetical protein
MQTYIQGAKLKSQKRALAINPKNQGRSPTTVNLFEISRRLSQ